MKRQVGTFTSLHIRLVLILSCAVKSAVASEIIVGDHQLLPNTLGQELRIPVTGGDQVSGIDLFVQIGDGGPQLAELGLPRGTRGPRITNVELIEQTIFHGVDDRPQNIGTPELDQTAVYSLSLIGSKVSVPASGTLARLTVDTTGLYAGTWDLRLSDVLPFAQVGGPFTTNFAGVPALIQNGTVSILVSVGDFNQNRVLDVADIDTLAEAIRSGSDASEFDVNQDGVVSTADHRFWIKEIRRTYMGDANLDGEFDSSDFVAVFQARQYEDGMALNSAWSTGDWDGDGDFQSRDIVLAFQDGGYEHGPLPATQVPEPPARIALAIALLALANAIRRQGFSCFAARVSTPARVVARTSAEKVRFRRRPISHLPVRLHTLTKCRRLRYSILVALSSRLRAFVPFPHVRPRGVPDSHGVVA